MLITKRHGVNLLSLRRHGCEPNESATHAPMQPHPSLPPMPSIIGRELPRRCRNHNSPAAQKVDCGQILHVSDIQPGLEQSHHREVGNPLFSSKPKPTTTEKSEARQLPTPKRAFFEEREKNASFPREVTFDASERRGDPGSTAEFDRF